MLLVMDWTSFREQFPVTRRWAYFDHAAVAPLSGPAQRAVVEWAADMADNGDVHEPLWFRRVNEVRGLAGRLLNADSLDVAFVKNTSEGIGIVAEGFPWQAGDNVVTAAEEYPANLYPWMNLASRGVELRTVSSRGNRIAIDDVRAAMDDRTRVLSLSWVEYASSHLCPSAASPSIGVRRTSSGNTPSPWMASTKKKMPRSRHSPPSASRSLRKPLANSTQLRLTTRVRWSMAARMSSRATRLPRLATRRSSTPRPARFIHG